MVPNCAVGLEENMIAASLRAQTVSALDGSGKPRTPESTAVIKLVLGCLEAQHTQARRDATASQEMYR
jgi:hypothetical protein